MMLFINSSNLHNDILTEHSTLTISILHKGIPLYDHSLFHSPIDFLKNKGKSGNTL